MDKASVVYFGTSNMADQMVASAKSLLKHTHVERVWFLSDVDEFPVYLPDVIKVRNVKDQEWFPPEGPNYNSRWTYMCLLPLAFPEIFPDESRVLRMDSDTIIEKDITPLLEMDLKGNYVAMVEEPVRSQHPFHYYNAGVTMMDLDKFRKTGRYKKMIDYANSVELSAVDQDAFNVYCQGDILPLGAEWNWCPRIIQDHPDPCIRHYAGYTKQFGEYLFKEYSDSEWEIK